MLRRLLHRLLPPRMKKFFYGDGACVWHSPWSVEEILDRVKATLPAPCVLDWRHGGILGRVAGASLHLGWKVRGITNSFAPVFHGTVTADPATGGAVIQGVFSANRFTQIFVGLWTGVIVLFGLASVWTILFPLAAWGMLWLLDGMMRMGDSLTPGLEDHIRRYLSQVCAAEIPVTEIQAGPQGE